MAACRSPAQAFQAAESSPSLPSSPSKPLQRKYVRGPPFPKGDLLVDRKAAATAIGLGINSSKPAYLSLNRNGETSSLHIINNSGSSRSAQTDIDISNGVTMISEGAVKAEALPNGDASLSRIIHNSYPLRSTRTDIDRKNGASVLSEGAVTAEALPNGEASSLHNINNSGPSRSTWTDLDINKGASVLSEATVEAEALPIVTNNGAWTALSLEEIITSLEARPQASQLSIDNFVSIIQRFRNERNCELSLRLHAYFRKCGLEGHRKLGNYLVSMLVDIGSISDAQQLFNRLAYRTDSSWSTLITGYAKSGEAHQALILYQRMQEEGSRHPSRRAFVALLKACAELKDLESGIRVHAHINRKGLLGKDVHIDSTLVSMYAKCGSLVKAQEVFSKLPVRNVATWNALIAGYVLHGRGQEALNCFKQMQSEDVTADSITFRCSLKACAAVGAIQKGQDIHAEVARKGLLKTDVFVGTALVDMYAKCGMLAKAREVFDKLLVRNIVSWNALIGGYAQHGYGKDALKCYEHMQCEGVVPDAVTYLCCLKACGTIGAAGKGQEIHLEIARRGSLERDLVVGTSLVDMYAKCGLVAKAQEVFDNLTVRNIVSWNALISGYVHNGHGVQALNCIQWMRLEGISPDAATFVSALKACGSIGAIDKGRELHAEIESKGLLEYDLLIGNALIDMYAKCGSLAQAHEVFNKLPVRDVISWNVLMAGYVQHGHGLEALNCLQCMQAEGFTLDAISYICGLKACGSIGAKQKGEELHVEISQKGSLERDHVVGTALVDMYAKCGSLVKAQEVFDRLRVRDVVSWTALIAGYAQVGESENVLLNFEKMIGEGIHPNLATFLTVLHACAHSGLVDKAQLYFEDMIKGYGLTPALEHYTCMIDLLGRAGQLDKAIRMLKKITDADFVVWLTVLGACQKWGNVELGKQAFEHAVQLDDKDSAAYICMANIYSDAGMLDDAAKIEIMRVDKQACKKSH